MSRFTVRRVLAVTAALVVGVLAQATTAFGADTFTPNPVNVTLAPGASTTVHKTLHLDALPGAADIIIAIDTTGSMTNAIAQAKAQATTLCNNVKNAIPGARFAVMDFRDRPDRPATDGVLILTPTFTPSCAVVQTAINTMAAGGGGDFAEAYNFVFHDAYSDAVLDASRNPDAVQFLVVLGDAPPHNSPAPTVAPACGNQPPADPGITSDSEIAGLNANDITLLMIHFSTPVNIPIACYQQLTGATGGTAVESGGDLSGEIISQIQAAAAHIDTVNLVVSGACPPVGISFSPAPPYGPFTAPVDIQFDESISVPILVPGVYSCAVTAVVDGTPRAIQHVNVTVGVPESTPGCKVTYGGTITLANGDQATFGGNAKADGLKGQEEYQDHGPANDMNVHSIDVEAVVCDAAGTAASIFGTATIDGGGTYVYRIDVTDNGEPGAGSDTYRIRLSNGYDSGARTLDGGNIQIH
jgi:Mg-chelatase subunit ChlD